MALGRKLYNYLGIRREVQYQHTHKVIKTAVITTDNNFP